MYYQTRQLQEMGVMDDDLDEYGEEDSQQNENDEMGYGSQVDDDEDIGVQSDGDDDEQG